MICDWSEGCTVKTPNPATQKGPGISEPQEPIQLWLCSATHHGSAPPPTMAPHSCRAEPKLVSIAPTYIPRLFYPYDDPEKSIQLFSSL